MLSHELFVFEAADAEAVVFEDDVVDDVEDGASSRSLLMQVTFTKQKEYNDMLMWNYTVMDYLLFWITYPRVRYSKENGMIIFTITRSGAIIGKRSVRLSKSARLLPMPSSSFSEGVTEEQVAPTCADDPLLATALTGLKWEDPEDVVLPFM